MMFLVWQSGQNIKTVYQEFKNDPISTFLAKFILWILHLFNMMTSVQTDKFSVCSWLPNYFSVRTARKYKVEREWEGGIKIPLQTRHSTIDPTYPKTPKNIMKVVYP